MNYKGVIFDLDGTLIDSIEDIGDSLNRSLSKFNLENWTKEDYTKRIGNGLYQLMLDSIKVSVSEHSKQLIYQDFIADYSQNYLNKTKAYEGINNVLETLQNEKILIGVNSNKADVLCKEIVKSLFSNIEFAEVLGDRKDILKKPDPTSANEIVEKMNLLPQDVVYIGDSTVDINTAKNANLDCIAVDWGFRSHTELAVLNPNYLISDVSEILKIVLA